MTQDNNYQGYWNIQFTVNSNDYSVEVSKTDNDFRASIHQDSSLESKVDFLVSYYSGGITTLLIDGDTIQHYGKLPEADKEGLLERIIFFTSKKCISE
jgi:hypothetical protein